MKLLLVAALFFASFAFAQDAPKAPKAPAATSKAAGNSVKGVVCDVWVSSDSDVTVAPGDVRDAGMFFAFGAAIPYADVEDNHRRGVKVLDLISKLQDKGGPYTIVASEYRSCDGGPVTQITDGSIEARGITLAGTTQIVDETIRQMQQVNDTRFKHRAKRGDKFGQDHSKAKKVKRDDLGRKSRD